MATKKKTNFISYELERLNSYMKQLTSYLDNNPPDAAQDRIETFPTERGGLVIKVIATKESQIKLFMDTLERLPKVLTDINDLRKNVEGLKVEEDIRGNQAQPGFMSSKAEDEDEDDDEPDFDNRIIKNALPPSSSAKNISLDEFDDAGFFNDEPTANEPVDDDDDYEE